MKVAFIGAGAMAGAIAKGAHKAQSDQWDFTFYDVLPEAAQWLADEVDGKAASSIPEAVERADMVVLAVKPHHQAAVITELPEGPATIVSIAAGRTTQEITKELAAAGSHPPVVRVMPNVNALVGAATSAICANEVATQADIEAASALFDAVGTTMEIPENLFSAFTALAGSSPAFFFQIAEHLARAGVAQGLTKAEAINAVVGSMYGSAKTLAAALDNGENAASLVDKVCSPGGTTIAGLLAAEDAGLGPSLVAAVRATVARDRELGHQDEK